MRHWHRLPSPALDGPKSAGRILHLICLSSPQTFATAIANVCNRHRKRLQPPSQTLSSAIANAIIRQRTSAKGFQEIPKGCTSLIFNQEQTFPFSGKYVILHTQQRTEFTEQKNSDTRWQKQGKSSVHWYPFSTRTDWKKYCAPSMRKV